MDRHRGMEGRPMKGYRQKLILELISRQFIKTQQQLQELLEENGVPCTQATLSRDLRALSIVKQTESNGIVHYGVSSLSMKNNDLRRLLNIAKMAAQSVEAAQNTVVVKTLPGLAKAVGSFFDKLEPSGLVGSIAGNDTILLIMKDNEAASDLMQVVQNLLSGKQGLP